MKVGYTDIEPIDRSFAVNHARTLFLNAISKNEPNVLRDLTKVESERMLNDWAAKYHLKADWILDTARETLNVHRVFPNNEIFWFPLVAGWRIPDDSHLPTPPKALRAWNAESEPRAVYLSDVTALINNELKHGFFADLPQHQKSKIKDSKLKIVKKYCDAVVKAYLDLKDSDGKPLWTATNEKPELKRNALWTVKFQVREKDYPDIYKVASTVMRPVNDFLDLIGLEKRDTSNGRRKGETSKKIKEKRFQRYAQN
jgi:hypothetical protein